MDIKKNLVLAIDAALKAGHRIMEIYNANKYEVQEKSDQSPVTTADFESSHMIYEALIKSNIPVITEEIPIPDYSERKTWEYVWMVDPLDGTKEFIKRNGEFTVNIGLIHDTTPVLGVIYIPVTNLLYFGADTIGSFKYQIKNEIEEAGELILNKAEKIGTKFNKDEIRFAISRSHLDIETENFIRDIKQNTDKKITVIGTGSSVKFCLIAEGLADIYLRFSTTMEWDTAAGHAIAINAGARIIDNKGNTPTYNKPSLKNEGFYVANSEYMNLKR